MFSYLSQLLRQFHSKPIVSILMAGLGLLVMTVVLASFVRWLRRRRQEQPDNWVGLVTSSLSNVLKVLVGLAVLVGLCAHLRFQAGEFERQRGGVSARNYDAVQTIWGRPHEQRELYACLVSSTKKYFDKDGLEFDAEKLKATSQPIAYRAEDIETVLPGNPILEAEHAIDLSMNYRRKGGASYPGFEVDCRFTYVIENVADRDATAKLVFPLPVRQGLVDNLVASVDGRPLTDAMVVQNESAIWKLPLAKGQKIKLAIGYHSRGLDYIRVDPASGRQLRKYRLTLTCKGVRQSELSSPIGCMAATGKTETNGNSVLEWKLDETVTRLGMGIILPKEKQDSYYVSKILSAAPWALVLLIGMVLTTFLATGRSPQYVPLLLLAVAFQLYYLLMANLGDYWPGLVGGMLIAGAVLTGLTAILQFCRTDRFAAAATVCLFVVFCVVYPLFEISESAGLLQTLLYVALLAYVIGLLVGKPLATWLGGRLRR